MKTRRPAVSAFDGPGPAPGRLAFTATLAALVFVPLAAVAASGRRPGWDTPLFARLYSGEADHAPGGAGGSSSPLVHHLVSIGTLLGQWELLAILVVVAAGLLMYRGRPDLACFVGAGVAVAALTPVLKAVVARSSPFAEPGVYGFPSGHAVGPMAVVATFVVLCWSTVWRTSLVLVGGTLVTAIGIAAVSDGGHWPSDVLGGWALALGWVCAVALVRERRRRSVDSKVRAGPRAAK